MKRSSKTQRSSCFILHRKIFRNTPRRVVQKMRGLTRRAQQASTSSLTPISILSPPPPLVVPSCRPCVLTHYQEDQQEDLFIATVGYYGQQPLMADTTTSYQRQSRGYSTVGYYYEEELYRQVGRSASPEGLNACQLNDWYVESNQSARNASLPSPAQSLLVTRGEQACVSAKISNIQKSLLGLPSVSNVQTT